MWDREEWRKPFSILADPLSPCVTKADVGVLRMLNESHFLSLSIFWTSWEIINSEDTEWNTFHNYGKGWIREQCLLFKAQAPFAQSSLWNPPEGKFGLAERSLLISTHVTAFCLSRWRGKVGGDPFAPNSSSPPRSFDRLASLSLEIWTKYFYLASVSASVGRWKFGQASSSISGNSSHDCSFRSGEWVFLSHPS